MSYMLRRFLHRFNWDETVAEAERLCPRWRIDEVMWIPVSELPVLGLEPLESIRKIVPGLCEAHERMRRAGVTSSINVFFTLGHGEFGVDTAALFPGMEFMVDFGGGTAKMKACPLSPVWRDWAAQAYTLLASTRPTRLWIDDDFRISGNHIVKFGCYCDRHLDAFARVVGERPTREQLVAAVLRPGKPHPWRAPWLDLQQRIMADAAGMLTRAVQRESPGTEMGWMATFVEDMVVEGRDPAVQLRALIRKGDPGRRQAVRINMAPYSEGSLRCFLGQDVALKRMLPGLPSETLRCTELEGYPNSSFSKSAAWYAAEMAWACLLGAPHQTLNVFDYYGGALADNPEIGAMLRSARPRLEALAAAAARAPEPRGARLLHRPLAARDVHTADGRDMQELSPRAAGWADPLRACGVPIAFAGDQELAAVTGEAFRSCTDGEISALFRRGALLDLSALRVLADRNLDHLAGARIVEEIEPGYRVYGIEELTDPEFGGGAGQYVWWNTSRQGWLGRLELRSGARPISVLRGPDPGPELPGLVLFENSLGGRVAVAPWDYSGKPDGRSGPSAFYFTPRRARQMRQVLRWLARDALPLEVEAPGWILPHRADGPEGVLLAAMNVNHDPWRGVAFAAALRGRARKVLRLDRWGRWQPVAAADWSQEGAGFRLALRGSVKPLETACVWVETEAGARAFKRRGVTP